MATFYKRKGKRQGTKGNRYTARVRREGREITKTFNTLAAAQAWARARENAIETGQFHAPEPGRGALFADLVDAFLVHRRNVRRPPGATFANALERLKDQHGLEPAATLTAAFWRRHALDRIAQGIASQTAASELAYVASVLAHAKREHLIADATGPAEARRLIADEGQRIVSRQRERRITDDELAALLAACDAIVSGIPLGAIVRFALATAMRRGEILRLRWDDVDAVNRVVLIHGRKHPTARERVDEAPLMPTHPRWPRWDALAIINAQPRLRGAERVFPYVGDSVGERFEHACAAAGLSGVVFHLLRHEALSRYAERGLDVMRLQLIGGHRDIRHVVRYTKLSARGLANE